MKHKTTRYLLFLAVGFFVISLCMNLCMVDARADEPMLCKAVPYYDGVKMDLTVAQPMDAARMKTLYSPGTNYSSSDMLDVVVGLAERLSNRQKLDGGWTDDLILPGPTADHIVGAVGLGMLRAYNLTQNAYGMNVNGVTVDPNDYLNAAGLAANYILDPNRPQLLAVDYTFLYCLAYWTDPNRDPTNASDYSTVRARLIAYVNSQTSAASLYNDFMNNEPQLAHWWAGNLIEACQLFGAPALTSFADSLVGVALSYYTEPGNVGVFSYDTTNDYVRTLSHARMIEVLAKYYSSYTFGSHDINTVVSKGVEFLKDIQHITTDSPGLTGAFRAGAQIVSGEVQAFTSILAQDQAFAVNAMAYAKQTTYANYNDDDGPYWGAKALIDMAVDVGPSGKQYLDGGNEYAEDNAEALYGFYSSCREGDVDKSGKVMAGDALQALKASVGQVTLVGPEFVSADRNGDGSIDAPDAIDILKHSVGISVDIPNI